MTQLSPHFTLKELTVTEHRTLDNTPSAQVITNLVRLAALLEQLKTLLGGKPIMVNSGYRSVAINQAVGGKPTSQHCLGCAADIRVPGMTPDAVVRAVVGSGLQYDQCIREFDSWCHISVPNTVDSKPRRQALIIDRSGTRPFT